MTVKVKKKIAMVQQKMMEDDDGIVEEQEDSVITAPYKKDRGGVDTPGKESFSSEVYCPGDFFIDELNCRSCPDIGTELADETFCIDGFDEHTASRISRSNVSAPEENNIDVAYKGRMAQDNGADPFFNAEKAPPPHPAMRYIIMSISSFAILGCLARIYTDILFHDRLGVTTTGKRENYLFCLETFCSRWWWWCSFLSFQAQAFFL